MQKHIKEYLRYFEENWICEVCMNARIVDIHHIKPRSSFWKKTKDVQDKIENLIGLCRECHEKAHFTQKPYLRKEELFSIHLDNLRFV